VAGAAVPKNFAADVSDVVTGEMLAADAADAASAEAVVAVVFFVSYASVRHDADEAGGV